MSISQRVSAAHWIQVPNFDIPFVDYSFKLYPSAILTMAPVAFCDHDGTFGHLMVLNSLTERDYFKDPGLDHTLTGDGWHRLLLDSLELLQVTSYGENIGVMALSKVYSVYVISGAAVIAVVMRLYWGSYQHSCTPFQLLYWEACLLPSLGLSLLAV